MSWWAVGPAGSTSAAGTQQAPSRATAEKDAQGYGDVVLAGPFSTDAQAQAWTASSGGPVGGQWWIEYIVAGGGSGGEAIPKIVQAASAPQAGGDIEWVFGPYTSKAAAQAAMKNGPPSGNPVSSRGLTDNSANNSGGLLPGVSNFFHALTEKSTWIRVAEVILGGALLLIALATLAGNTQAGRAAKSLATKAAIL